MNNNINEKLWDDLIVKSDFDCDLVYAKGIFFNKSDKEISESFYKVGSVIGRSDELRFMPDVLFNHYIHHFFRFILEIKHSIYDKDDIASVFHSLDIFSILSP